MSDQILTKTKICYVQKTNSLEALPKRKQIVWSFAHFLAGLGRI
jgi:hypothetical protein